MLTKVQKWGNSLAVRIPSAFGLYPDSEVEMKLENNKTGEKSGKEEW